MAFYGQVRSTFTSYKHQQTGVPMIGLDIEGYNGATGRARAGMTPDEALDLAAELIEMALEMYQEEERDGDATEG